MVDRPRAVQAPSANGRGRDTSPFESASDASVDWRVPSTGCELLHDHHHDWSEIEAAFHRLKALDRAERVERLARIARDDPGLAEELSSLLAAHDAPGRLDFGLAGRRAGEAAGERMRSEPVGGLPERIGRYRPTRELGHGGMSVVYLAERADGQFRRRVALKLLDVRLAATDVVERFELERQVLAALDHPNIARLLDAGRTDEGRPYLVLEYVHGAPIDEYCDHRRLSIERRLRLLMRVADAVEAAHRSLVVHRDLKPGNILVTEDGSPKLLDFGIAKLLLAPPGADGRPLTRLDSLPMTPEYASPEQKRGGVLTTASDVYALGLVAYELLAGRHPFAGPDLAGDPRSHMGREPRPASRLARRPAGVVAFHGRRRRVNSDLVAAARGLSAKELESRLSGDLDAILRKATATDPSERYGTAGELRRDIDRHLRSFPIEARPAGRLDEARRFVRRHPTETGAALVAAISLLVGTSAAVWQASTARAERDEARAARVDAEAAVERARIVTGTLTTLFEQADPWQMRPVDPEHSRRLVEEGLARVDSLDGQPLVQADLLDALARVQLSVFGAEAAEPLALRAIALRERVESDPRAELASSLNGLGAIRRSQGRSEASVALHRRALEIQERRLGADHPRLAETLSLLARAVSDDLEREALRERALEIHRSALDADDPLLATSLMEVGRARRRLGRAAEAETAYREALDIQRRSLGANHPEVAKNMVFLADLIRDFRADTAGAEELYEESLEMMRGRLGERHPALLHPLEQVAALHTARGEYATAERLYREGLAIRRNVFGAGSPMVAIGIDLLGSSLARQGRTEEAERYYREALALLKGEAPESDWTWAVSGTQATLADLLTSEGRYEEAERLYRSALSIRSRIHGEEHFGYALVLAQLGRLKAESGDFTRAISLYERAIDIGRETRTTSHPDVERLRRELAEIRRESASRLSRPAPDATRPEPDPNPA